MLALLRAAYSGRSDTHLVASMEQALPLQSNWLNFNRFCVRAEGGMPIVKGLRAHVSAKGGGSSFVSRDWSYQAKQTLSSLLRC